MIGLISSYKGTTIEVWPIFGNKKGIPNYAQFKTNYVLPSKWWGTFGISFSSWTMWVNIYISTYPVSIGRVCKQFKTIYRDIKQ